MTEQLTDSLKKLSITYKEFNEWVDFQIKNKPEWSMRHTDRNGAWITPKIRCECLLCNVNREVKLLEDKNG